MKKIYEVLIETLGSLDSSGYMKALLKQYNIHLLFNPLYETFDNPKDADFLTAFIILAYSNKCSWIMDIEKDRRTLKLEIVNSILVESKIEITDEVELIAIKSTGDTFDNVVQGYLNWQKNALFVSYISKSELISMAHRKGMASPSIKYSELKSLIDSANNIEETQRQLDEIKLKIEREYTTLDEALKKENRRPMSKDINIFDYESMLQFRSEKKSGT